MALLAGGASAGVMTSGYSVGSGLLTAGGKTLFVDTAALGGNVDLKRATPNDWDTYLIPGTGLWSIGDTVEITGLAIPILDGAYTQSGTLTFTILQAAGGAGTSGAGGLTALGTATASLDISTGTSTYYVNFDTPVSFVADANSASIGIHVASSAPLWIKAQSNFEVTKYNRTSGDFAGAKGKLSVAGTVNHTGGPTAQIQSFSAEASLAQRPDPVVLNWSVTGTVSSLVIEPGVGDVTGLTTNGTGSVEVYPLGSQTYTLTLNGALSSQVDVIGLAEKEKLHIYLLIGQSNMQGEGRYYNSSLDGPHPRVLKFGSREGMETVFAKGTHKLYNLTSGGDDIGMGVEFGKTLIAAESDPEVMLCLINHAYGNTAIDWWMPGVMHPTATRADNSSYFLYDEAVQRVHDAENHGVIKGVLWHQGEWNSSPANDPDPNGYLDHLKDLVDNLRADFNNPSLPFICGKLVPEEWPDGTIYDRTGSNKDLVEDIMENVLPNHRNNTFCADNNGLRGHSDELVHFDAYSQRLLGQRYAAAMLDFYSDPYLLYLGGYLTPAQMQDPVLTDPLRDNDGDGRSNFLEYALRFNPMQADFSAPLDLSFSGQTPRLSYNKRTDTEAPVYSIDFSTNLVDWVNNAVVEVEGSPVDHNDGSATVTVQPVEAIPNGFFRLQVEPE